MIDISVPIDAHSHVYPGDPPPLLEVISEKVALAAVSRLSISTHVGTHLDAPAHMLAGGATAERLSLDALCGPCQVADLSHLTAGQPITAQHLRALQLPPNCRRLLLRTTNSEADLWAAPAFVPNYSALAPDAAWVLALPPPLGLGLALVGIDYLSVDPYWANQLPAHRALLANGVIVLEGLDLRGVRAGAYELLCLPLKLVGADGAPARAALRLKIRSLSENRFVVRRGEPLFALLHNGGVWASS